jgi:hypothetical protein
MIMWWLPVALLVLQLTPPAQPASPPTTGTGGIRGQVLDTESGQAIPRAAVTLRLLGSGRPVTWQTVADGEGRFEFHNLPAGQLMVTASAGEHRETHQGGFTSSSLKLANGEIRADVTVKLTRAFAISGRLLDEDGAPLAGMGVSARSRTAMRSATSDDRGLFRIFGLLPGRYVVCANPGIGPRPPNVTTVSRAQRYIRTCQPSALTEAEAQTTTLGGSDVDGIEIRVRRSPVYSISGTVLDSKGELVPKASVSLTRHEPNATSGMGTIAVPAPDGNFVFSGAAPGEYVVGAMIGGTDGRPEERGRTPIRVDADDVNGVLLTLRGPATVSGRLVFEDGVPAQPGAKMMVMAERDTAAHYVGPFVNVHPAEVTSDMTFTLSGLFGPFRLHVSGLRSDWIVKSMHYRGADITDEAVEFTTDPRHQVEIVLTGRTAQVSGFVMDENLKPAFGAMVLLIPADSTRRPREWYRLTTSTTAKDGKYTRSGVRPGDYLIAAVSRVQYEALQRSSSDVDVLAKYGERISLVENDKLTMNLRVVTLPDR